MKNILIIGVDSCIGIYIKEKFEQNGWGVFGTSRHIERCDAKTFFLDLLKPNLFCIPDTITINVVVYCASITFIKLCSENEELCHRINVDAQIAIAQYLREKFDPFMIFLSSNTVFDGRVPFRLESDLTCPINSYGKCKADAEKYLLPLTNKLAIIRATKILYSHSQVIQKWVGNLRGNIKIYPLYDLTLSPISAHIMIEAIYKLSTIQKSGIYHLSGSKDVTYFEIAIYLSKKLRVNEKLLIPTSRETQKISLNFAPKYTSLDMENTKKILLLEPENFQTILDALLD